MGFEILIPIFGIMIVLVPITGLTAILTLRLGGKPFIETLARELGGNSANAELKLQLRDLTEQIGSLSAEVHELRAAQSFDRRLIESRSPVTTASEEPTATG